MQNGNVVLAKLPTETIVGVVALQPSGVASFDVGYCGMGVPIVPILSQADWFELTHMQLPAWLHARAGYVNIARAVLRRYELEPEAGDLIALANCAYALEQRPAEPAEVVVLLALYRLQEFVKSINNQAKGE